METKRSLRCFTIVWVVTCFGSALSAQSSSIAAKIGQDEITVAELDARAKAQIRPLEEQIYTIRRQVLEQMISERLMRREAERLGTTVDDFARLVQSTATVTDSEVDGMVNQAVGIPESDLARQAARLRLLSQARAKAIQKELERLRSSVQVQVLLPDLPPEMAEVETEGFPALGAADALVTIVEFADFQCPFCATMNPILHDIVRSDETTVRWIHRDFPLPNHPMAGRAAEAARCANEQGRFWDYQIRLFEHSSTLSEATLETIASDLGMNLVAFRACGAEHRYVSGLRRDLDEGRRVGVRSTPTLVVNGKVFRGAMTKADLEKLIKAELEQKGR